MSKLGVQFCGVKLANPTVLASGIMGATRSAWVRMAKSGCGAVTTKSISLEPRQGHDNPTVLTYEKGMLNAVGLSNAGVEEAIEEIKEYKKETKVPIIASIFGASAEEYRELAEKISQAQPDLIEANIYSPNVKDAFGQLFAQDPGSASEVTKAVKARTKIPVLVKLSPNVTDIVEIGKAVEAAGADGLTAINTLSGMLINIETAKPILKNKSGGVSGTAIRPIAVKMIHDLYLAVKIPILGMGGVSTGRDAIELMMAGATAVGIGTAVHERGFGVFQTVASEMTEWMQESGYKSVKELVGAVHNS